MLEDIRAAVPRTRTAAGSFEHYSARPFLRPDPTPTQFPGWGETGDVGTTVPGVRSLLTPLPGYARDRSAGLLALGLRLQRAQVLGLGLLPPRHGAKMRLPAGPQEWPPEVRAFPDFGGTPPHRPDRACPGPTARQPGRTIYQVS